MKKLILASTIALTSLFTATMAQAHPNTVSQQKSTQAKSTKYVLDNKDVKCVLIINIDNTYTEVTNIKGEDAQTFNDAGEWEVSELRKDVIILFSEEGAAAAYRKSNGNLIQVDETFEDITDEDGNLFIYKASK